MVDIYWFTVVRKEGEGRARKREREEEEVGDSSREERRAEG